MRLVGTFRILVQKGHFGKADQRCSLILLRDEVKEYKNIGTAYVTSAMELSKAAERAGKKSC